MKTSHEFSPKETGGMLLGHMKGNLFYITDDVEAGPNAVHEETFFLPDGLHQQTILEEKFFSSNGKVTYLGDWHSHPNNSAYLSLLDKGTLSKIGRDKNAQICTPIFIIIGTNPIEVKGWKFLEGEFIEQKINVKAK